MLTGKPLAKRSINCLILTNNGFVRQAYSARWLSEAEALSNPRCPSASLRVR